MENQITRQITG